MVTLEDWLERSAVGMGLLGGVKCESVDWIDLSECLNCLEPKNKRVPSLSADGAIGVGQRVALSVLSRRHMFTMRVLQFRSWYGVEATDEGEQVSTRKGNYKACKT